MQEEQEKIKLICPNTKKPCENATALNAAIEKLREAVNRSVLLGAMIGAGIGSALKDVLRGLM